MKNSKFLVLMFVVASAFCMFGCKDNTEDSVITVEVTNWEKDGSTVYGYTEGLSFISGAQYEGTGYQVTLNIKSEDSYLFANIQQYIDGVRQGNMLGYQSKDDILITEVPADGKFTFTTVEFNGYTSDGTGLIDSGKTFKIVSKNASYKE